MPSDTYTLVIADAGVSTPADGSVTTGKIANLNVTTAKLENYTTAGTGVTTAKLDNGAVTSAKIAATTITDANIAIAANIALSKLATGALPAGITVANATLAASATTANNATTAATCTGNAATATTAATCTGNAATATLATTATNLAVGTAGALPYQTTAGATAFISAVATGNVLLSGGAATVPFYGKVNLTAATHIAGILPVAYGGTGVTAASTGSGGVVLSSGPTLVAPVLGTPAAGSILTNCTGLPLTSGAGVTGILPVAYGGTGAAALTGYVKASGTAVMTASASVPVGEISGTLPIDKGGTNRTSIARGQISKMTTFTAIPVGSTGTYYPATNDGTLDTTTSSNMTLGATSTFSIRNTSGVTRIFRVYASADAIATANDTLGIKLYSGTAGSLTQIDATECRAFTNSATESAKLVTSWMISLSDNQEVALYVANHTDAANITIQRARLIAEAII